MAIAPLQLPGPLIVPKLDFTPLDQIGDAYVQNQKDQRLAAALGGLAEELTKRGEPTTPAALEKALLPPQRYPAGTPAYPKTTYTSPSALSREAAAVNSGTWQPTSDYEEGLKLAQASLNNPPSGGPTMGGQPGATAEEIIPGGGQPVGDTRSRILQRRLAEAQQSQQPGQLPLGLRNNNPGYIPEGAVAKALPGYRGAENGFAAFETPDHGLGAMDALLTSFGRRGIKTGGELVRQLPGMNPNNADDYARFISPNGDPNAAIDLSDPAQRKQMVGRMSIFANDMHGGMGMTAPAAQPSPAQMAEAAGRMPPEMAKRVQTLAAVGSPAATQLAISIIGKYVGKQEYDFLTLADGTVARVNKTTGTVEPVYTAHGTVDVKTPGPFGTTNTTTMQRDANGNLRPLQITGTGAPATAAPSADEGLTGEEYLKTLKPEERDVIRKIANYETDPRLLARGGPGHAAAVISSVARFDPTYDQALYPARAAAFKEFFAGGNSSPAGQITAGNTAIQHLGRVMELSDKIGGTENASILNKPINWLNEHVQEYQNNPDLVRYKGAMDRFVEEATKFYRGTGGNEADINRALANMTAGQSPAARTAAIKEQAELMQSKINALSDRLKNALGPALWERAAKQNPELVITQKKSADVMSKLRGEAPATGATLSTIGATPAQAGAPAGPAPPAGFILNGYRFNGGNPDDPKSWGPVAAGDRS